MSDKGDLKWAPSEDVRACNQGAALRIGKGGIPLYLQPNGTLSPTPAFMSLADALAAAQKGGHSIVLESAQV